MINLYRYYSRREELHNYYRYDKKVQHAKWRHFDRDDMTDIEHIIARSPRVALHYIIDTKKGRWLEAEQYMAYDPDTAVTYATNILKGPFAEAEPNIMKDPISAYRYARDVMHCEWPEAEPYIKLHPQSATGYSCYILNRRWPEAEAIISANEHWSMEYEDHWSGTKRDIFEILSDL